MSPSGKKYKKEYAFELLRIAQGDFESAKILSHSKSGRPENALYLAQQSVEKCLKAVLCYKTQQIIHTHDIEALTQVLPNDSLPPDSNKLSALTQYATIRRYEEGYEEISKSDLEQVLSLATQVLTWAQNIINN